MVFFFEKKFFLKLLPFFIFIIAIVFRLYGVNWDANFHLHPDERFLTMVGTAMKMPISVEQYLNPNTTTFSPYNIGFDFYVYGVLPVVLTKVIAIAVHMDSYDGITIVGRIMSALFDLGTLIVLYRIVLLFEQKLKINRFIKYATILVYASSVLPIQLSHYFTTDSALVFFAISALYFSLRYYFYRNILYVLPSSIFFACAVASKISAIYILPLLLFFIVHNRNKDTFFHRLIGLSQIINTLFFSVVGYFVLRIVSPQLFAHSSFFEFSLHPKFLSSITQLKLYAGPQAGYFPPAIQWFSKQVGVFGIQNILFFGLGVPLCIFVLLGLLRIAVHENREIKVIIVWMFFFVLYQTIQFAPSMRYFYIAYPLFALCAGYGIIFFVLKIPKKTVPVSIVALVIGLLLWPLGFVSIYGRPHSRVTASEWIYNNIPNGSVLLTEHWDDGLPLSLPNYQGTAYTIKSLPVFGQDNPEKWKEMKTLLNEGNYIIFSSNRGYGSIIPDKKMYPEMSKWYEELFNGQKEYKKIIEFVSYPQWCLLRTKICISYPDQWSEEAFTVYDHPKVTIFTKM